MRDGKVMDKMQLQSLVFELTALPNETEWMEFKHNKVIPDEIGEYVSALANSAALHGKPCAYVLWGVDDKTRQVVGTTFRPRELKVGNEAFENWLLVHLDPRVDVRFHEGLVLENLTRWNERNGSEPVISTRAFSMFRGKGCPIPRFENGWVLRIVTILKLHGSSGMQN